ncbi:MAG: glycosyltransferase [Muricauda sp.]|nr:glycosyltransferase [Allomuricauda sp.]
MGKICFFNTAKAWGGGEKWHFEVSKYLFDKGYDVMVIAKHDSVLLQKLKAAGVPCQGINLTNLSFLNPFKYRSVHALLKKEGVQTIVMNLSRDIKVAGPSAKKARLKRIIYRRGSAIPIKNTFLNRYYFKKVLTEVLANSEATKRTILASNPDLFPKEKITVIHNGIDLAKIKSQAKSEKTSVRKEITLLNLGRLEFQKNQTFLVHLSRCLKDRNIPHKMIIGGSGRLQVQLEALIEELGVSHEVVLKGFIEDPISFIQQADVFVLPSFWEGFGYVLAEAALCRKPIIAFNISSNPELVLDGETGFLVPEGNLDAFAKKVQFLYENPDIGKTMGNAGFAYVSEHFDREKQIEKIEAFLIHGN